MFLASDDRPLSTTELCELIAKGLGKKVYLLKVPFFESLIKVLKPSFHKRLYGSLEVDNSFTKEKLKLKNPYGVEEGVGLMIHGPSF
jgi:UDP-glucose 4-epimerase